MKITKKLYNFGLKKSANYNSVSVSESIEVELSDDSVEDLKHFEGMKSELKQRVRKEIDDELAKEVAKQPQPQPEAAPKPKVELVL